MQVGGIEINEINIEFFRRLGVQVEGSIDQNNPLFREILSKLFSKGDSQLKRMMYHAGLTVKRKSRSSEFQKGHFSEQFNLNTGFMQGAKDLTWSHASYMTALMRRFTAAKLLNLDALEGFGAQDFNFQMEQLDMTNEYNQFERQTTQDDIKSSKLSRNTKVRAKASKGFRMDRAPTVSSRRALQVNRF